MSRRTVWVCGLCAALASGCSSTSVSASPDASPGLSTGSDAGSLVGTWTLTATEMVGRPGIQTTVIIGQDSLSVTSPSFTLTATRTGSALTFTDDDPNPGNAAELTATQTAGTFNAGILPFDLGGSWTMQAGPKGASPTVSCTLSVTATEIDGACQQMLSAGLAPWFTFTTHKTSPGASSLGDFGGQWTNTWTWAGTGGGPFPCALDFTGNSIATCDGGAVDYNGSPLAGITFTYDGANAVSGAAQTWAEFSATR